jgi:predicted ATP-grasp superfamily ATP-dependent carboligase
VPAASGPWVVKPDDGAGAVDTSLVHDSGALAAFRERADLVVQPYVAGTPASLTLLCRDGAAWLLTVNRQDVTIEQSRFRFAGVTVGWAETAPLAPLADAVAAALPGLWGLVGVDFVATPDGPVVIEVNPRVTTAYAGLGASIGDNPAALVLALQTHGLDPLRRPLPRRPVEVRVA